MDCLGRSIADLHTARIDSDNDPELKVALQFEETHDNSADPQAVTIICCEVDLGKVTTWHYVERCLLPHKADVCG